MDQSKSDKTAAIAPIPKRTFTVEFAVGFFTLISLVASAWLAVGLGGIELFGSDKYTILAEFDNVSGLKGGASVEIGGVPIGEVAAITLKDPQAIVVMKINPKVKIQDDDIAAIRTKGIIGDRYVKISRGASEIFLEPGDTIIDTESVVDIEDIIGKLIHNFTGDDSE